MFKRHLLRTVAAAVFGVTVFLTSNAVSSTEPCLNGDDFVAFMRAPPNPLPGTAIVDQVHNDEAIVLALSLGHQAPSVVESFYIFHEPDADAYIVLQADNEGCFVYGLNAQRSEGDVGTAKISGIRMLGPEFRQMMRDLHLWDETGPAKIKYQEA